MDANTVNEIKQPIASKVPESPAIAPAAEAASSATAIAPPVGKAMVNIRHHAVFISFIAIVLVPLAIAAAYLYLRAHDRYVSHVAFSVRSEEVSSAMEMLGGIAQVSGSSSSDTDILYNFIKSDEMVRALDARLDLRAMWSKPGADWWDFESDPWYAYTPPGMIEKLTEYWSRMVKVYSDSGTGLIDVEAQAFSPDDAKMLTEAIFDESSSMINRLSEIAREDKIRYARDDLEAAVERLKQARAATTTFRNENQIIDPQTLVAGQAGLMASLQEQLAQALISLDTLSRTTQQDDPRITQSEQRVEVISNRITEERKKLGLSGGSGPGSPDAEGSYADIFGAYEALLVDQQFAEQRYTAALAAFDTAQAEAARQSRYLAAHIRPSMPEMSTEPNRERQLLFLGLILTMVWILMVLVGYALRDRR